MYLAADDQKWADEMLAQLADQFAEIAEATGEQTDDDVASAMAQAFVDELEYQAAHGEERALRVMRAHVAEGLAMIIQSILDEHDPGDDEIALDPDELWTLFEEVGHRLDTAPRRLHISPLEN